MMPHTLPAGKAPSSVKPFAGSPLQHPQHHHQRRRPVVVRSTGWADPVHNKNERAMFGEDFGARDPTAGELASNFSDKVLGNWDTAHIIKIPAKTKLYVGIAAQSLKPVESLTLLQGKEFELVKNQVPGWKVALSPEGRQSIRQEWKAKDAAAAAEIASRLGDVAAAEGYTPASVSVQGETVAVELTTAALGGLTENDFIVASRMNDTDVKDLIVKKKAKFWA